MHREAKRDRRSGAVGCACAKKKHPAAEDGVKSLGRKRRWGKSSQHRKPDHAPTLQAEGVNQLTKPAPFQSL